MALKQEAASLYESKITLMDLTPAIWRRVTVPRDVTLGKLHDVIQIAMGWEDDHLHEFLIGRKRYGPRKSSCITTISATTGGTRYISNVRSNRSQARCIAGANACPPEDCRGPYRFPDLVAILFDPQHEEHSETHEWIGENFDPQHFDLSSTNRRLSKIRI